jgi:bifunctional non-homologous end joining protein LigD
MLLRSGELPVGGQWSYEPKWDGFRALAVADGSTRLLSRRGNDLTYMCEEINSLGTAVPDSVLDGELVAFRDGQASFEALQGVMRREEPASVAFLAFDVLWLRGVSLVDQTYDERREALEGLDLPEPAYVSPRFDDGEALFNETLEQGYEGVVAKRRTSIYRCGERTSAWVKTKHWREGEFVMGGWSPPHGDHGWGLLVGERHGDALRFRGRVEFGFAPGQKEHVATQLASLRRSSSPFADRRARAGDVYVEPVSSAEVRYRDLTSSGILRHATFRQLGGPH